MKTILQNRERSSASSGLLSFIAYNGQFRNFLFIVSIEMSIFLKNILHQTSVQFQYLYKFHIDPSPGSLLNGQLKILRMVQKKLN